MLEVGGAYFAIVADCTYVDLFLVLTIFLWRASWGLEQAMRVLLTLGIAIMAINVVRIILAIHMFLSGLGPWETIHYFPDLGIHVVTITIAVILAFNADLRDRTEVKRHDTSLVIHARP